SLAHATRCSLSTLRRPPTPPLFPYTTLFRSEPLQNVVDTLPYDRPLAIKPEQVHQVAYRGGPGDEHPSIDYLVAAYGTKPGMRRGMDAKNSDENPYLGAYAPAVEHFKVHGELPLGVAHGRVTPCLPARTARS